MKDYFKNLLNIFEEKIEHILMVVKLRRNYAL